MIWLSMLLSLLLFALRWFLDQRKKLSDRVRALTQKVLNACYAFQRYCEETYSMSAEPESYEETLDKARGAREPRIPAWLMGRMKAGTKKAQRPKV